MNPPGDHPGCLINAYFTHDFPPESIETAPEPVNQYGRGDPRVVDPARTILFCENGKKRELPPPDPLSAASGYDCGGGSILLASGRLP